VVAVIVGAGLGAGLVAAWATWGAPTQCVASQPVATLTTLTPVLIVNSPYGGYANGTWTRYMNTSSQTIVETDSVGARNGSITYLFYQFNWTVWTTQRLGNPTGSCAGVFAYSGAPTGNVIVGGSSANYTNDSQGRQFSGGNSTPTNNGVPYSVLYFNDSFYRANDGGLQTCAGGASQWSARSTYIDYRIPFEYQGSPHVASVTFNERTNFTYTFPATGGSWEMDDLSSPGGPGGGLSFSYVQGCK